MIDMVDAVAWMAPARPTDEGEVAEDEMKWVTFPKSLLIAIDLVQALSVSCCGPLCGSRLASRLRAVEQMGGGQGRVEQTGLERGA